ncbi:MAG TPA: GNAT family N-acetyltransferase [Gemmatimonadaceae bacterium]|nr:GNAT family N-acetyltransferase [Gemmatimonadaceae bacterium]
MKRTLCVRAATLDDLDAIVELRLSLLREYHDHPFYANLRPNTRERAYELYHNQVVSPNETIFIAERADRVVGVLRCVDTPTSPVLLPERYCYVSSVYVVPDERKKGVLRALLEAADRWCEERGLHEMRLHNSVFSPDARQAWKALGFEVVEEVRRRALTPAAPRRAAARPSRETRAKAV